MVRIYGTGSYLPDKIITNADWEKTLDTSDEWITTRTGIKERRWTDDSQATSDLCFEAAKRAIENSKIDPQEIDSIIIGTVTPDHAFPSTACILQNKLNIKRQIPSFDISAACTGFIYGLEIARNMIESKSAKYILVLGAETLSKITDKNDRSSAVLFGDGAGAAILGPSDNNKGILGVEWFSDGSLSHLLIQEAGGSRNPSSIETVKKNLHTIKMLGNETYKHAVTKMGNAAVNVLKKANLKGSDVDVFIPHQANLRIMQSTAKRAKVPLKKVYITINKYGNMSAATIPVAMDEASRDGTIKDNSIVLLDAFGGGLTWGAMVLRW